MQWDIGHIKYVVIRIYSVYGSWTSSSCTLDHDDAGSGPDALIIPPLPTSPTESSPRKISSRKGPKWGVRLSVCSGDRCDLLSDANAVHVSYLYS